MTRDFTRELLPFIVAAVAVAYSLWTIARVDPSSSPPAVPTRPHYYIPNAERSHLEHVQEAFDRAGYELVTNENYTDDWYTMWTFHNPFWQREPSVDLPAKMQELQSHQKVNHLPGASFFTSKVELAKYTREFEFIPKSFLLPKQYSEFMEYQKERPEWIWVRKGRAHRGIRVIDPNDPSLQESVNDKETLVQQFIKPYLVDNRLWDIGIYVAIPSIDPLRINTFDNVLIRSCTEEFDEDLRNADREAYVVSDDYLPPWGLPSFRPYYTWGMSTLNVLRAYFTAQGDCTPSIFGHLELDVGMDVDAILTQMKGHILELIGSYVERLRKTSQKYPHGHNNFYSMYRVDFIIDRNFKPWITEINQSPNLSSHHFADLATMFQRIVYSLLSLVGLAPGGIHHPLTSDHDLEVLLHANDIDIGYDVCHQCLENCDASPRCTLCRPCRTPRQSRLLKEFISEQRSRLGFVPLYPLRNSTFDRWKHLALPGVDQALLQHFILAKCTQDYTWC